MRWKKMHTLSVVMLLWLMAATGTGAQPVATITGPREAPVGDLVVLDASQSTGCTAYLWLLTNSDKTFLPVEGGLKVVFASGTPGRYIFVLVVAGVSNNNAPVASMCKYELTITGGPTPPPPVNKLIDSFAASHETVSKGEAVTFTWATRGATLVKFNEQVVVPSGTQVVAVNETSTYTLTASDATHVETQQRRVVVADIPPPTPGKRHLTILRETAELTPELATLQLNLQTSERIKGKHRLTLLDPNGKDQSGNPSPRVAVIKAALGAASLPGLVIEDEIGKVLFAGSCPATADEVLALLTKYGG